MAEQSVMEGGVQVVNQPLPGEIVEHRALIAKAKAVRDVVSPELYEEAGKLRVKLDLAYKAQKGVNDIFCKGLSDMHKRGTKKRAELLAPYLAALKSLDDRLEAFRKLEAEKRAAEERRIAEELRKKQEEEALQAAQEAEDSGDSQMAEAILEAPVEAPHVRLQSAVPRVAGLRKKQKKWRARVVNLPVLVKAVSTRMVPPIYITADLPELNAVGRRTDGTAKIPGVIFEEEK